MEAVTADDRQALLAQYRQAHERLEGLVRGLRAIDHELEGLATERQQHRLLHDACGALDQLAEIGGAALFWGASASAVASAEHLRGVRSRVEAFEKRIGEIEDRREAALEEIDRQELETDRIGDDLLEAQDEAERRQQEWVIEREPGSLPARALIMPWTRGGEEDQRFRRSLVVALLSSLLFALIVPHIPLPLRSEDEETAQVPERVVRLMMEKRALPPAPPREEPKLEPEKLAEQKAEEPAAAKPRKEGPGKGSGEGSGEGPAKGPGKGILAFREKFSGFTETQSVAGLGAQAKIDDAGDVANVPAQRAMITTQAPGSSGGINLAALSRGVGGGGNGSGSGAKLAGVQIARATSTIAGGGGRSSGRVGTGDGPPLGRTDEEIQIVFDRHKASLYRLYNRELRSDPTLKGQMVLRLRIEPDGRVSLCELSSTDMKAAQLAAQVVDRVRTFDFGAKEVPAITILYPIDFLPAT
jgi:hypothetical protein